MTHEQHARAFLRWHSRRGGDLYDDWGAWLRTHRCDFLGRRAELEAGGRGLRLAGINEVASVRRLPPAQQG